MKIDEEIDPKLVESWKLFDEKARSLNLDYGIESDEPSRQVYSINSEKNTNWKTIVDYMFETDNIKNNVVFMKIDPSYKKGHVFLEFTIAAINDDTILKYVPHLTINQKIANSNVSESEKKLEILLDNVLNEDNQI